MCCGQSASADCINAKQRWLRQVKSAERTFELHTPHILNKKCERRYSKTVM